MLKRIVGSTCAAALLSVAAVAAQAPQTPGGQTGQIGQQPGHQADGRQIVVTGCVQHESEFLQEVRRERPDLDLQSTGNQYVLTEATEMPGVPGRDAAVGTTGQQPGQAQPGQPQVGQPQPGQPQPGQPQAGQPQPGHVDPQDRHDTQFTVDGEVYSLTGEREFELAQFVGQRVEITGTIEHDSDRRDPVGTTGVTPHQPGQPDQPQAQDRPQPGQPDRPQAQQPGHQDWQQDAQEQEIPEINVTSIRPVAGAC